MADRRGVGLPLSPGQLPHLHGEVADGRGPIAARDPLEPEAASCHFCLGHQQLSGGCRPLCNQMRTDQGQVRAALPGRPPETARRGAATRRCSWSHSRVAFPHRHVGRVPSSDLLRPLSRDRQTDGGEPAATRLVSPASLSNTWAPGPLRSLWTLFLPEFGLSASSTPSSHAWSPQPGS